MKIEAMLWANTAFVDASFLLHVEGACWRFIDRADYPETISGSVCGVVLIEDEDFGAVHTIALELFDDAGQVEGSSGSMLFDCTHASEEMSTPRLAFAFPFTTVVREPTLLKARLTANGNELGNLSVIVRRTGSAADG